MDSLLPRVNLPVLSPTGRTVWENLKTALIVYLVLTADQMGKFCTSALTAGHLIKSRLNEALANLICSKVSWRRTTREEHRWNVLRRTKPPGIAPFESMADRPQEDLAVSRVVYGLNHCSKQSTPKTPHKPMTAPPFLHFTLLLGYIFKPEFY